MTRSFQIKVSLTILILLLASFSFALASSENHLAQSDKLESALQDVADSVEEIPTDSGTKEILDEAEEILKRQEALVAVLEFSRQEIFDVGENGKLSKILKNGSKLLQGYSNDLIERLAMYSDYIDEIEVLVDAENITLEEVQQLATDFKIWRETVFDPDVALILDISLVGRGEGVLLKAESRFEKILHDIEKLDKAGLVERKAFNKPIKKVRSGLENARRVQFEASEVLDVLVGQRILFWESLVPEEEVFEEEEEIIVEEEGVIQEEVEEILPSEEETPAEEVFEEEEEVVIEKLPSIEDLIRKEYIEIRKVYKDGFFKINSIFKDQIDR